MESVNRMKERQAKIVDELKALLPIVSQEDRLKRHELLDEYGILDSKILIAEVVR